MPWALQDDKGNWGGETVDPGLRLASAAHRSRSALPVNEYLSQWPADIVELAQPIQYVQPTILQLCAQYPAAQDLARCNMNLLWLVAARYATDRAWRYHLPSLLTKRQRQILAAALDMEACVPAQVRFLRKVAVTRGDQHSLEELRENVADLDVVRAFSHWPRLPCELLDVLDGPVLRHLYWLRDRFGATDNRWLLTQYAEETSLLIRDTTRLLKPLEQQIPGATIELLRSTSTDLKGLRKLHDAALEVLHAAPGRLQAELPKCEDTDEVIFGPPPLPSCVRFQAITTLSALEEEGRVMRHCVATRLPELLAGECFIYRSNVCGERGTLQISNGPDGLQIDEFRLKNNGSPSGQAWREVRVWLAQKPTSSEE
jgi:hypothetical protein